MEDNEIISRLCEEAAKNTPDVYDKILQAAKAQGLIKSSGSGSSSAYRYNPGSSAVKTAVKAVPKSNGVLIGVACALAAVVAATAVAVPLALKSNGDGLGGGLGDGGNPPEISAPDESGSGGGGSSGGGDSSTEITVPDDGGSEDESGSPHATVDYEGLRYVLSDDGTYYDCTGFSKYPFADVVIASEIEGLPVTGIADNAFYDEYMEAIISPVKSVTIPDSVTTLGDNAFRATGISTITISENVTVIGRNVFKECGQLFNAYVYSPIVGFNMFAKCTRLDYIYLADNILEIDPYENFYTFSSCSFTGTLIADHNGMIWFEGTSQQMMDFYPLVWEFHPEFDGEYNNYIEVYCLGDYQIIHLPVPDDYYYMDFSDY